MAKEAKEPKEPKEVKEPKETPREQALEKTLSELTKRFGDGTIVRLGDANHMSVSVIPTGSLAVDIALGVGGISRGRGTEIYCSESSCQNTLFLHTISRSQARRRIPAFLDMEQAL